jgi:hypothetical protein
VETRKHQVQLIKVEKHLSYPEARKSVETVTIVTAVQSYAAAVKVSMKIYQLRQI